MQTCRFISVECPENSKTLFRSKLGFQSKFFNSLYRSILVFAAFQILASCASGGYSRSYIISDVTHEEAITESAEQRY